jgi:hypothetical protein
MDGWVALTPISDSKVGTMSIWLVMPGTRRGLMPAPRMTPGMR